MYVCMYTWMVEYPLGYVCMYVCMISQPFLCTLEVIIIVLCKEENQRRLELEQSGQVADLIRRRLELEFNNEKKKMQSTLELTISQLNNSQKEVIDKSLIANLVVSYFKKKRLSLVNVYCRNTSTKQQASIYTCT